MINTSTTKHLLIQIIERSKGAIFILRSVFVYTRRAERTLIRIKQACCVTKFHFGKDLFYKQTYALAVLLRGKYCLKFVYGRKFYYQLRIGHLDVLLKI